MDCLVKGRIVRFCDKNENDAVQSLLHHAIRGFHERIYLDTQSLDRIKRQFQPEETMHLLQAALNHHDLEQFIYYVPEEVSQSFSEIILAASPPLLSIWKQTSMDTLWEIITKFGFSYQH